ncbi:dapper homolog 3-like [Hyaena hyaena]|uniref:dapper homolog 3-like n=1 Tax=Hyaena hyaena TaxID=95912 RepID=UPI0019248E8C|nr:dapper homolog 3-like [Hyaena hyaena]
MGHGPVTVWGLFELVHECPPLHSLKQRDNKPWVLSPKVVPWDEVAKWLRRWTAKVVQHGSADPSAWSLRRPRSNWAVIAPCDSGGTQQSEHRRCRRPTPLTASSSADRQPRATRELPGHLFPRFCHAGDLYGFPKLPPPSAGESCAPASPHRLAGQPLPRPGGMGGGSAAGPRPQGKSSPPPSPPKPCPPPSANRSGRQPPGAGRRHRLAPRLRDPGREDPSRTDCCSLGQIGREQAARGAVTEDTRGSPLALGVRGRARARVGRGGCAPPPAERLRARALRGLGLRRLPVPCLRRGSAPCRTWLRPPGEVQETRPKLHYFSSASSPFRLPARLPAAAAAARVWGPPASYSPARTHCAVARSHSRRHALRGARAPASETTGPTAAGTAGATRGPARPVFGARDLGSRPRRRARDGATSSIKTLKKSEKPRRIVSYKDRSRNTGWRALLKVSALWDPGCWSTIHGDSWLIF